MNTPRWRAWLPVAAAMAGVIVSWPARLGFRFFLTGDLGANLGASQLAAAGHPIATIGFPFGPLTLWLQRWAVALPISGAVAMTLLTLAASISFAAGAVAAIRWLELSIPAAALLIAASFVATTDAMWVPVYPLEAAVLLWAIVLFAAGRRPAAIAACVVAALLKPSMGVVLGALLLAHAAVELRHLPRPLRTFLTQMRQPALAATVAGVLLTWSWGARSVMHFLIPLSAVRDYQQLHYSFFSRADNPFVVAGARLGFYLGTPVGIWGVALLLLPLALAITHRQIRAARWWAAAFCWVASLAFILGFYSWKTSYRNYLTLPLLGVALLPWPQRRWVGGTLWLLAALTMLGAFSQARADLQLWRGGGRLAEAAGTWALPEETAVWNQFAQRNPPATQPLLLIGNGEPEAIVRGYGPAWHGYLFAGEATPAEMAELERRLRTTTCVAFAPGVALPAAVVEDITARRPTTHNTLFDSYGCGP